MVSKKKKNEDNSPPVTETFPAVPNRVLHVGLTLYKDEACRQPYERGTGIIIEPLDPEDQLFELDIMPTTFEYEPGQYVQFQTNHHKMWDAAWFHNPITNKVEKAWKVAAAEFVGPLIEPETLQSHRQDLDELERRMNERFKDQRPSLGRQAAKVN